MADLAVVVPTLGRPDAVRAVLLDVLGQLGPADEVLVVDQSDAEARAALQGWAAARDPRVRVLGRDVPGLPAARNAGIAATRAPIVLFLDDDVRLHPRCLDAHRAAYADPVTGGVVGRIAEARLRPNARRTTNRVGPGGRIRTNLAGAEPSEVETLKGANMSFLRVALEEAGPFDEGYRGTALLEDADLSTRVRARGWRLRFEPAAAVDHLHLPSGGVRQADALETERWRFRNTGRFVRRHGGRGALLRVAPTFAAIAVKRAVTWRRPGAVVALLRALVAGFVAGGR